MLYSLISTNALNVAFVRQCKELELYYGTEIWKACISSPEEATEIVKEAKNELLAKDWDCTLLRARSHSSLSLVSDTMIVNEWLGVWDEALNHGTKGTKLSQCLLKVLCKPLFGDRLCELCSCSIIETSYADHNIMCSVHALPLQRIIVSIRDAKSELFTNPSLSCTNFYK